MAEGLQALEAGAMGGAGSPQAMPGVERDQGPAAAAPGAALRLLVFWSLLDFKRETTLPGHNLLQHNRLGLRSQRLPQQMPAP